MVLKAFVSGGATGCSRGNPHCRAWRQRLGQGHDTAVRMRSTCAEAKQSEENSCARRGAGLQHERIRFAWGNRFGLLFVMHDFYAG